MIPAPKISLHSQNFPSQWRFLNIDQMPMYQPPYVWAFVTLETTISLGMTLYGCLVNEGVVMRRTQTYYVQIMTLMNLEVSTHAVGWFLVTVHSCLTFVSPTIVGWILANTPPLPVLSLGVTLQEASPSWNWVRLGMYVRFPISFWCNTKIGISRMYSWQYPHYMIEYPCIHDNIPLRRKAIFVLSIRHPTNTNNMYTVGPL